MTRQALSVRAERKSPGFGLGRQHSFWEIGWVAIVLAAILFNLLIGPLTPLIIIVSLPAFVLLRWEQLARLLGSSWPLLLVPALAIASAFWSELPLTTARYGVLYLLTALCGIVMGGAYRPSNVLLGMFCGFFVYGILSFLSFRFVPWGGSGGQAFAGLAGSKNSAGDIAALTVLTAAATLALGVVKRSVVWTLAPLLLLPIALFCLWASHATAALISCFLALSCMILWWLSRSLGYQWRMAIFLFAALLVGVALATQHFWLPPLFDFVLAESGKSADLTGRVDIWRKADELIAKRPWLGLGYNAFWVHGNLDAEYLWRLLGIASRSGFNFHNTPREILVHLGIVGLVVSAAVAFVGAVRLLLAAMGRPSAGLIYQTGLLVFFIPKLAFEVIGFGTMHFSTILFFAILAAGFRPFLKHDGAAARHRVAGAAGVRRRVAPRAMISVRGGRSAS
ncbi:MAG: O-antigen ligase family protein [Erythrobacter sp.]